MKRIDDRVLPHEHYEAYKQLADRIALQLLTELKSGAIAKIDIDTIREALKANTHPTLPRADFEVLEEMTTRRVVERAS